MSGATLRMGAFRAALSFARRRVGRGMRARQKPWMPVALRWRRAIASATRAPGATQVRPQPVDRSPWRVHMHLHMDAASQRAACTANISSPKPSRAPTVAPDMRLQQGPGDSRTTRGAASIPKFRSGAGAAMPRSAMHVVPMLLPPRAAPTEHQGPMGTMQLGSRAPAPSGAPAPNAPAARRPAVQPATRVHRARPVPATHRVEQHLASVIDAFATRSPELTWRTRAPTPTGAPAPLHVQASMPRSPGPAPGPQPACDPTADTRAALRTQPLDPTFVDRVADDVIRRIDRQLRIERERRGL